MNTNKKFMLELIRAGKVKEEAYFKTFEAAASEWQDYYKHLYPCSKIYEKSDDAERWDLVCEYNNF